VPLKYLFTTSVLRAALAALAMHSILILCSIKNIRMVGAFMVPRTMSSTNSCGNFCYQGI
jgi:hypothetical protein